MQARQFSHKDRLKHRGKAPPPACGEDLIEEDVRKRKTILINDFQLFLEGPQRYPSGYIEIKNFLTVPILQNG